MKPIFTPRQFLYFAGTLLTVTGILGLTGLLQRIGEASFFHPPNWINWLHTGLGIIILLVAYFGRPKTQTYVTMVPAFIGTILGLLGLFFGAYASVRFNNPTLADNSDHFVHLFIGLLAFWALTNSNIRHRIEV